MQPTAMQEAAQWTLYCPLFMESDKWLTVVSAYQIQMLISSKIALSSTMFT